MSKLFLKLKQLFSQKHTLKSLTIKNLKAKYVGSIMGITWVIITPLLMTIVISFVFTKVLKVEIPNFQLFILSGFLPWIFFSRALFETTNSIIDNVNLLNQFKFSREIIPLSYLLANFIGFILGFIVILPIFVIFEHRVILYIWFLPIILVLFLLFTSGICLFLSSLNVLIRDVGHILEVGLLFWFWMSPIFYSVEMIPAPFRIICYINPLTFYMIMFRNILYNATFPNIWIITGAIALAFITQILGYMFFIKVSPEFLKRL